MGIIALIPARANSKRIPHKNIRLLGGHPLLAYSIQSALDSQIFDGIYVSSDSEEIGRIAEYYGAEWIKRPDEFSTDTSPDVEWITHAFERIPPCDAFAIIRPTSPFRTAETIKRAWREWDKKYCLKAIQKVSEHPGKMWVLRKKRELMLSFLPGYDHLEGTQTLEDIFIQNASLEFRTIQKANGMDSFYEPFFTHEYEGFDLNTMWNWIQAEVMIEKGLVKLPKIEKEPYGTTV